MKRRRFPRGPGIVVLLLVFIAIFNLDGQNRKRATVVSKADHLHDLPLKVGGQEPGRKFGRVISASNAFDGTHVRIEAVGGRISCNGVDKKQ